MAESTTRFEPFPNRASLMLMHWQAPLLLPLFALLPKPAANSLPTAILYMIIDLLSAHALMQIAESDESRSSRLFTSPRKDVKWDSIGIGAA